MINSKHVQIAHDAYKVFGWIVASMSLISFIQRSFNVGLNATLSSFVDYYRQLAHAVLAVPAESLSIALPNSLIDFWAISFICAGAYVRSENIENARAFRSWCIKRPSIKLRTSIFLVFGLTGISLFVPLSALSITTYVRDDITQEALKNLLIIFSVAIGFYVINAFSPSA